MGFAQAKKNHITRFHEYCLNHGSAARNSKRARGFVAVVSQASASPPISHLRKELGGGARVVEMENKDGNNRKKQGDKSLKRKERVERGGRRLEARQHNKVTTQARQATGLLGMSNGDAEVFLPSSASS